MNTYPKNLLIGVGLLFLVIIACFLFATLLAGKFHQAAGPLANLLGSGVAGLAAVAAISYQFGLNERKAADQLSKAKRAIADGIVNDATAFLYTLDSFLEEALEHHRLGKKLPINRHHIEARMPVFPEAAAQYVFSQEYSIQLRVDFLQSRIADLNQCVISGTSPPKLAIKNPSKNIRARLEGITGPILIRAGAVAEAWNYLLLNLDPNMTEREAVAARLLNLGHTSRKLAFDIEQAKLEKFKLPDIEESFPGEFTDDPTDEFDQ